MVVKKEQTEPTVGGFKLKANLQKKSLSNVADILRSVSFLEVALEKDAINAAYIESRDINKSPYLFSIVRLKKDEVEVIYSIPAEISPLRRRIDVIRYLLNILSLVGEFYYVDNTLLYQIIEDTLNSISESVSIEYSKLYASYDNLKSEVEGLRRKNERMTDEVKALGNRNFELKARNDELSLRLNELEALSDKALKAKVQEWIAEHDGEINVHEFAKVNKVIETRVEDALNKLVSEGYLELLK
ncbi:MAG TPA: hypothetical protein VI912_03640 [Candidatus Bilamarchaeaceae archaeon]|nr:hypothetical protein [Candidatus Bilamarchaeaceae archaeon]